MAEITSLGVAIAAARAVGFLEFLRDDTVVTEGGPTNGNYKERFVPRISAEERSQKYSFWKEAVQRSMHWAKDHRKKETEKSKKSSSAGSLVFAAVGGAITSLVVGGFLLFAIQKSKR
jgi:hypothetical protein